MKITSTTTAAKPLPNPNPQPDRPNKKSTPRKKSLRTPKKSGPPTPLLRWKFNDNVAVDDLNNSPESHRKKSKVKSFVSSRKLAAALWRLQLVNQNNNNNQINNNNNSRINNNINNNDDVTNGGRVEDEEKIKRERLLGGFKPEVGQGGDRLSCLHASASRECRSEMKDPLRSPCSVNGPINGYSEQLFPFHFSNYAMEGATKWDPVCLKASGENLDDLKAHDEKLNATSMISTLEAELQDARVRIEELETEKRSSKKKLEHFLKKLSEERAAWRSREHEKVHAIIDDVKSNLNRERKNRQRLEVVNSKLVNELAEAKLAAKRYMQDYEKERKTRELIEEVCDELAKEIGEDKAEINSLKKECMKAREEVEDERKMLQMAEVWREERVQMKLIDAKVALDQRYSQMSYLVAELEKFLRSKDVTLDVSEMKEAEKLRHAAASVNIQDIKEFTYEPSHPDDIFAVVEEMAMAENAEREIEPCVEYSPASHVSRVHDMSPEINNHSKSSINRHSSVYLNQRGNFDDDGSGWETVSHAEDQGSSFSPEGSTMSVNKMCRDSNVSGSCTEWEEQIGDETPITEISEVCSVQSKQAKKVKSIARLWKSSNNGDNYKTIIVDGIIGRLSNGRLSSNGAVMSPDRGSGKGGVSPSNKVGWSSPDSANHHLNRGRKGCIEWPRGALKNSLKHKLLEARMEGQKIQLKHVLKQKI